MWGKGEPAVVIPFSFFTQKIVRAEHFVPVCACRKEATKQEPSNLSWSVSNRLQEGVSERRGCRLNSPALFFMFVLFRRA